MPQKVSAMEEWWDQAHELIVGLGFQEHDIADMVRETPLQFRHGCVEMIALCDRNRIPVLVFSAGIADIIECCMRDRGFLTSGMHVISNRLVIDAESKKITGVHEPIIHVFNKNEFTALLDAPKAEKVNGNTSDSFNESILKRKNVILLGDSLGDVGMGAGVKHETMLTIGFNNRFTKNSDENSWHVVGGDGGEHASEGQSVAEKYAETFDIVLSGDMGFDKWLVPFLESVCLKK